jgi:hypothetical protein
MGGACSTYGRNDKLIQNFGGKTRREEITRRPGLRWKDNIRTHLGEIGWEFVDWRHLAQNRDQWRALVNTVMNLQVPQKVESFLTS